MTYKKTLEKEIQKSEDSMMDNATEMLECSQYELGYQDGIKFALNAHKNYDEMYQVVTAAAEIANRLRVNRNQAITECNNQGFKLTRINKDNKTLYAHFMHRNKEHKIRIKIDETGTTVTYNIP